MADLVYMDRYDRHCLDKLINTSTEERLRAEGHVFMLTDGTEYEHVEKRLIIIEEENPV